MKKILLSATAFLSIVASINAQTIQPCNTYGVRETLIKTLPGYAAKLNAAEAAAAAEYHAFLQNSSAGARTSSLDPNYTFTVPVVFHVLHLGETPGSGSNINDQICIDALAQVNRDFSKQGSDTSSIDALFQPLYKNARMHFKLAQKDPNGNCTNGIVHHYDPKSNWDQSDIFSYQYSTYATGNWSPAKYLNIYVVKNIIGSSIGIIVGYTYLPGTSPVDAADAIVYRNDFLSGSDARSLSHEIGHWFGLSHTFGSTNEPGLECSNDDIADTPKTTGFFSTCPKAGNYAGTPTVTAPADSSDIIRVKFGSVTSMTAAMTSTTALNSLAGSIIKPIISLTGTLTTNATETVALVGSGVAGGYSDFSAVYGNDFNAGTTNIVTISSLASYSVANYVAVYCDYNRDGDFLDANESIFNSGAGFFGPQTFSVSTAIPAGLKGPSRMRVITSDAPITSALFTPASGEVEDYTLNIGLPSCDNVRPNIENIMDYSSCPKMFTQGQVAKMRQSASSIISNRSLLVSDENLYNVGFFNTLTLTTFTVAPVPPSTVIATYTAYVASNATSATPCGPVADFASNKSTTCAGQSIIFNSTAYNSTPTSYSWVFEGGSPATSTLATQSVNYAVPGTYSVSLTVSNGNGSSTKTVNSFVTAGWNAGLTSLPYSENFESGQWWPAGWVNINEDINTHSWQMSNYGAGTLSNSYHSLVLPNANYVSNFFPGFAGNVDIMETPNFDFTNTTNISLSFDYSFARKTGVTTDEFKLQYSTDCGGSWSNVLGSPTASVMAASGGNVNAPYIPLSSLTTATNPNPKWVTKTIIPSLLTSLNNKRDVKFRFYFMNDTEFGESQNLYIDNINISGTVGINEFENSLGLSIYPNPTSSSAVIELTSPKDSKIDILVYDVTGRIVEQNSVNALAGVNSKYAVNSSSKLNSGIYFVTLVINNNKITKKLIID
jgi:PKD repeat protein